MSSLARDKSVVRLRTMFSSKQSKHYHFKTLTRTLSFAGASTTSTWSHLPSKSYHSMVTRPRTRAPVVRHLLRDPFLLLPRTVILPRHVLCSRPCPGICVLTVLFPSSLFLLCLHLCFDVLGILGVVGSFTFSSSCRGMAC